MAIFQFYKSKPEVPKGFEKTSEDFLEQYSVLFTQRMTAALPDAQLTSMQGKLTQAWQT